MDVRRRIVQPVEVGHSARRQDSASGLPVFEWGTNKSGKMNSTNPLTKAIASASREMKWMKGDEDEEDDYFKCGRN